MEMELSLQEIKETEYNLLKMFDSFCKENEILYFLSNGTLLGAIKYKGFIPWDDDVDVLVPREDYNKLLSLFRDNDRYKLFAFEKNREYLFPFAKLCDMKTRKEEENVSNGVVLGIDIDIFPLDSWDSDYDRAKQEAYSINRKMFYLTLTKLKKPDSLNPVKKIIKWFAMLLVNIFGGKFFIKSIIKSATNQSSKESSFLGCKSWCIYGEREIIPAEAFSETIEVDFEGQKFSAPKGYDTYLRSLYGDYEKDPPAEQQKTHHKFSAYRI